MEPSVLSRGPRLLQWAVDAFVAALLLIIVIAALSAGDRQWWVLGISLALAATYAVGESGWVRGVGTYWWGAVLTGLWVALVLATPTGVWLAFPLFFLALHTLGTRVGVGVVVALTGVAIAGFAWHRHEWSAGGILGPILGAAAAIATHAAFGVAAAQNERRGALEERDRLAREIHDTIAQGLGSIHLLLGAAEGHWESDPAQSRALMGQARGLAADNLEEARRFVRALTPADLAEQSLAQALHRLAERYEQVRVEVTGPVRRLPGGYDVALLRIAQEAVGNAVRHADATRIAVTLTYMEDEVALDVVDDGTGAASEVGGFGMTSMRQRAEELGGRFVVESTPGSGTAVAVALPHG